MFFSAEDRAKMILLEEKVEKIDRERIALRKEVEELKKELKTKEVNVRINGLSLEDTFLEMMTGEEVRNG